MKKAVRSSGQWEYGTFKDGEETGERRTEETGEGAKKVVMIHGKPAQMCWLYNLLMIASIVLGQSFMTCWLEPYPGSCQ